MQGDPACGLQVDPTTAAASMEYQGNTSSFCSEARLRRLQQDPRRYAGEESSMSDTTRTVLIALGLALLVAILLPALFMSGMMGAMMGGGGAWVMLGLVGLVPVACVALRAAGLCR